MRYAQGMNTTACSLAFICTAAGLVTAHPVNTNTTGGSQPAPHRQNGLALHHVVQTQGVFGIGVPIRIFAYSNAAMSTLASTWVLADGRLLPINTNQSLFSQLGTNFGGNGQTNFAMPDLRGRGVIGEGTQPGGATYQRGVAIGSESTTFVEANLPAHTHTEIEATSGVTQAFGSSAPYGTHHPSLPLRSSIRVFGVFPSQGGPFDSIAVAPIDGFISQIFFLSATPTESFAGSLRIADATLLPISQNQAFFALIGTVYGGNGQTNFAVPDLRGRRAVASGQGPGLPSRSLGQAFGAATGTLLPSHMPYHNHTVGGTGGGPVNAPTGYTGAVSPTPVSFEQPSLAINYYIAVSGIYPSSSNMSDQSGYIGEVIAMANNYVPAGYLACNGQVLNIAQYDTLFSLLGTTFGGNGITTFALPDLRGRVPVGASLSGGGLAVGTVIGSENVTLTTAMMPAHRHTFEAYCPSDLGTIGGVVGHDNVHDNNDFIVFINYFFAQNPLADVGRQGGVSPGEGLFNNNDFVVFIDRFFLTCP